MCVVFEFFLLVYFDDLLLYYETTDLHLCWTFEHLRSKKVYAGPAKCEFRNTQVEYLDYIIGSGVVAVDPSKTHAIMDWPEPTYVKHI